MRTKKIYWGMVLGLAVAVQSFTAGALTIVPTFDTSITGDPNAAAMEAGINNAIQVLQSNITDNVTVRIKFVSDSTIGLGQSSTWGGTYSYSTFLATLKTHAKSLLDTRALTKIPTSVVDPVLGGTQIFVNKAPGRLLGLTAGYGPDGFDSTITFNMTLMNFTRGSSNSSKYDLAEVAQHEMNEVLGTSSGLPDSTISPIDLFRYTSSLARTYVTNGDDAYFSTDGTNLIARFNMNGGGDYGDWWSLTGHWAPAGSTAHAQVQDAFGRPGTALDNGASEWAMLDVIGWTLSASTVVSTPPVLKLARTGVNQYTLSWSNNTTSYMLQERTNATSGTWVNSASGSSNPAVVTSTAAQKIYRLYSATTPAVVQQATTVVTEMATGPDSLRVRKYRPTETSTP